MSGLQAIYTLYLPEGDEGMEFVNSLTQKEQGFFHGAMTIAFEFARQAILKERGQKEGERCPK